MNTLKKILSLLLIICMITAVLSFTACSKDNGEDKPNTNENNTNTSTDKTYTVIIVDGDKAPVEGVKLAFTDGTKFEIATTGADGKASAKLPEGTISVMITSVPKGYEKPKAVSGSYHGVFAKDATELTVTVAKEASNKVTYTVKVVDNNNDPVVGISVQLCYNGTCAAAVATDENGEMKAELTPGTTVDVMLHEIDGYTLPTPVNGDYHAVIEAGETEITVTVTKN